MMTDWAKIIINTDVHKNKMWTTYNFYWINCRKSKYGYCKTVSFAGITIKDPNWINKLKIPDVKNNNKNETKIYKSKQ